MEGTAMNRFSFIKPGVSVKLRNGTKAEIYAVKPRQEWRFIGAMREDGKWVPQAWNKIGKVSYSQFAESDDIVWLWNRGAK